MISSSISFAAADSSSNGIGAFNINLKSFVFQLVTFVIVLFIFKRWILPPITKTLEDRRMTVEKSLKQAKETEEALAQAEVKAEEILTRARKTADEALAEARSTAKEVVTQSEAKAAQRAALIVKDAQDQLNIEREKLRLELRHEMAELVADATQKIIEEKLDAKHDMSLIERAIKGAVR